MNSITYIDITRRRSKDVRNGLGALTFHFGELKGGEVTTPLRRLSPPRFVGGSQAVTTNDELATEAVLFAGQKIA